MNESLASPENPQSAEEAFAYCAAEVRRFDPDRYFTTLFAGEAGRRALVALYAFSLEIAKTRETVSEPMLGQIRLQWWREAIEGIYTDTPRSHAVVTALAATVARDAQTRTRLERMIDGRERDLDDSPFETIDDLVEYADATSGELACLALSSLVATDDTQLAAARSAGIAWALTGLLRAIPFHAAQGRCFLPRKAIDTYNVSLHDLFAGRPTANLNDAVAGIAGVASEHLGSARPDHARIERDARPVFATLSLIRSDLRRLEKTGFDVFALRPQSPLARQLRVMKTIYTGRG